MIEVAMAKRNFNFLKKIVVTLLNQLKFENVDKMKISFILTSIGKTEDFLSIKINSEKVAEMILALEQHDDKNYINKKKISRLSLKISRNFLVNHKSIFTGHSKEYLHSLYIDNLNWINLGHNFEYRVIYDLMAKHNGNKYGQTLQLIMNSDHTIKYAFNVNNSTAEQESANFQIEWKNKYINDLIILYLLHVTDNEFYSTLFPAFNAGIDLKIIDDLDNKLSLISMCNY